MSELREKASVAEVGQHLDVAKDIVGADDAQQVVAFLLKSYFSGQTAPRRSSEPRQSSQAQAAPSSDDRPADGEQPVRRRRRRRRRPGGDSQSQSGSQSGSQSRPRSYDTLDATEALAGSGGGLPPPANPAARANGEAPSEQPDNNLTRVRVNIGFDDGFKGRGAVAKKISALAGLNDGIVVEVESRREYAVLQVTPDIAELLIERVDGAQIGKKIVSVAATS